MVRDPAGRPVESRVSGADAVFREYDALARLTAVRIGMPQALPVQTFVYHDAGKPTPPDAGANTAGGRLVRVNDEAGTTIFDYDVRGRQTRRRWRGTGRDSALEMDMEFRSDGRLAAVTYPDGGSGRRRVESSYDRRGRLVTVSGVVPSIQLDIDGPITGMRYSNGTQLTAIYDDTMRRAVSRVITSPAGWQRATNYTWDKVGNLLAIGSTDDKLAAVYTYDDLYRLTNADTTLDEHFQYRFADNGAIAFKSDVGEYRYGEAGAPPTCLTTAGSDSLAYAPTGEITSAPWGDQTFDALGRLRRIAGDGSTIAEYVYDWKGRRVSSTIFDSNGNASSRLTPDPWYSIEGEDLVLNLFAGDQIVGRESAAGTTFLHFDHLGGLIATTDDAGTLIETLRYDPFGRLLERSGPASQAIGFTGGEYDVATELLYLQARYYHPVLGIFISVDPIVQDPMMPVAWAAYAYCGNNPTTRIDPSGASFNLVKFTVGVLAVVALTAALVVSAGALAPAEGAALAAEQEMAEVYVAFGELTGGAVGGITVAREESQNGRSPDFWDVALGAVVGAAVSGWATYATVYGQAAQGKLTGEGVGNAIFARSDLASGALNNAITQTATGFAHAVARPIAGTGGLDLDFAKDIVQSFIAGAASGYLQSATIGQIPLKRAWNTQPLEAGIQAGINSMEQVATSQIEWHHVFIVGTAENAFFGSGLDLAAGFAGIKLGPS